MRFGTFGREDGALIILYKKKGLDVKILQRQFNINSSAILASKMLEQDVPLNMPKKTKLFVEQSQRERDQSSGIFCVFNLSKKCIVLT
jgi:Bardet-Biedl syndrome 1 protein